MARSAGRSTWCPTRRRAKGYAFGENAPLHAGGKPIRVPGGDAGPFAADWDGDGKTDLVVGARRRQCGSTATSARRGAQAGRGRSAGPAGRGSYGADVPKEPRRGVRAKVCARPCRRGRPARPVGGRLRRSEADRPEPSAEERRGKDKARKELSEVMGQYRKLSDKLFGPKAVKDKAQKETVQKELQGLVKRMGELRKVVPPEYGSRLGLALQAQPAGSKAAG
ncbi:MAG: VCBS repeat-containing protein [Gemmataceae bacterium]